MTWLKGQTTWDSLVDKLTKLACGEAADDSAITVAAGDQWIREIAGQDLLRSPASQDVTVPDMSNRAGYWVLASAGATTAPTAYEETMKKSVCRQTAVLANAPSGSPGGRWYAWIQVYTPNTVPGNYSTMGVYYYLYDADTGANFVNTSMGVSAAGVVNLPTGATWGGGQVTFSHPDGIIPAGTTWYRAFTPTYLGGIDCWPMLNRKSGPHTFVTAPPGVAGTDYDVVEIPTAYVLLYSNVNSIGNCFNVHLHQGLGIKTNTALTGALYTVNWPMAGQKFRLFAGSGATNGFIFLEIGAGGAVDGATYRQFSNGWSSKKNAWSATVGNGNAPTANGAPWLLPFSTPGSVAAGAPVQYWMSVKADRIAIVLNGDPGYSGVLACNWIGKFTPYFPEFDKFTWAWGKSNYYGRMPNFSMHTQHTLVAQKFRMDGSEERDWQTGWMRLDGWYAAHYQAPVMNSTFPLWAINAWYSQLSDQEGNTFFAPMHQSKPSKWDNKWWMYGFVVTDRMMANRSFTQSQNFDDHFPRGKFDADCGCLYLPGHPAGGWASGDELTDTVTGDKYFLVSADNHGIWSLMTDWSSYRGGAAILED